MQEIPRNLLRFFEKEAYAASFIAGRIRFGLLDRYREVEGLRRDDTEGKVSLHWDTNAPQLSIDRRSRSIVGESQSEKRIRYIGRAANKYYLLCATSTEVRAEDISKKFGCFVVRIEDSRALFDRIKAAWRNHPLAIPGGVFLDAVVYNKGEIVEPDPYLIAPFEYSRCQKPKSFEDEREFRYSLECKVDEKRSWEDSLTLSVGDCGDICRMIKICL